MGKVGDTVSLFNTTVRTLLGVVVVGGLSLGSYFGYSIFTDSSLKDKALNQANKRVEELKVTIEERDEEIKQKQAKIEAQATALRFLKFTRQLARITVKSILKDGDGQTRMVVDFVELDSTGRELTEAKRFEVLGDEVFVDAFIVKFNDSFIETGIDPERKSSICMFRRVFGSKQMADDDNGRTQIYKKERQDNTHPLSYSHGQVLSPLEERIWKNFWEIANDPDQQNELGISSNHGQAVSIKPIEGKSYQIRLRASDGLSLLTDDETVVPPDSPAT